jgi:hypothetical protein
VNKVLPISLFRAGEKICYFADRLCAPISHCLVMKTNAHKNRKRDNETTMKNSFAKRAKSLVRLVMGRRALQLCVVGPACLLFGMTLVFLTAGPAHANELRLGPVIDLSDPDALAGCDSNGAEKEASIAVNPTNPRNIVASWWGGFAKGIVAAVSFDGGKSWQQVVIPGLTLCTGGRFDAAFDNWLTFAPSGELYASCVAGNYGPSGGDIATGSILVSKSTDGGSHWSPPATVFDGTGSVLPDKPSSTADPADARFVYAIWDNNSGGNRGQAMFSRTTDSGLTWEAARVIYAPGTANLGTVGHIISVLPDGTLVDMFTEFKFEDGGTHKGALLSVIRSIDKGQTWSSPVRLAAIPVFFVVDPETGIPIINAASAQPVPAIAMNPINGELYIAFEYNGFSGGQYSSIAFTMSSDDGLTWSTPIQVNKTPTTGPPANRQAFIPSIAVAADGTIGVSYYDFRFNDANPGLPTDYWLVHCHPSAATPATDPGNWGSEARLTATSFDIEGAPTPSGGYFIGDYEGTIFWRVGPSHTERTRTASSSDAWGSDRPSSKLRESYERRIRWTARQAPAQAVTHYGCKTGLSGSLAASRRPDAVRVGWSRAASSCRWRRAAVDQPLQRTGEQRICAPHCCEQQRQRVRYGTLVERN